ncbi:hypothetical protein HK099_000631, partial [Clydaea vesicula]
TRQLNQVTAGQQRSHLVTYVTSRPKLESALKNFLLFFPLTLDYAISLSMVFSVDNKYPIIISLTGVTMAILQTFVGGHFLIQSIQFSLNVTKIQKSMKQKQSNIEVLKVLTRLNKVMMTFGCAIIFYVITTALTSTSFFPIPIGFYLIWGIGMHARAATSLCRVYMFKPSFTRVKKSSEKSSGNNNESFTSLSDLEKNCTFDTTSDVRTP